MLEDYDIQPFSLDCYPLIEALFLSAFETKIDYAGFLKKYDTTSLGHPVIGFIAIHKSTGEAAAFYGVFPVMIIVGDQQVLVAQSGDTMTHKNHQRKGLFIHLAKITFHQCEIEGVQFVFGLPNKNSYHGFVNKLGWIHSEDIERHDLKLAIKTFPLPKIFMKANLLSTYTRYARLILTKRIAGDINNFCNPLIACNKILRNKQYLEYKTTAEKMFIKIDDVVLWIKLSDVFWIGEISDYDKVSFITLKKIRKIAFLLGYNTITFHINKSIKPAFLAHFKKYESEPLCYHYLNESYENNKLIITAADFDTW